MNISYIMTIGSIIYLKGKGYIISGSVDLNNGEKPLDIENKESEILIKSDTFYKFWIRDIRVSTSIAGNLSLGILVDDLESISHVKVGDKVYSIIND